MMADVETTKAWLHWLSVACQSVSPLSPHIIDSFERMTNVSNRYYQYMDSCALCMAVVAYCALSSFIILPPLLVADFYYNTLRNCSIIITFLAFYFPDAIFRYPFYVHVTFEWQHSLLLIRCLFNTCFSIFCVYHLAKPWHDKSFGRNIFIHWP